jgi:type VI secretion system protein ImpL
MTKRRLLLLLVIFLVYAILVWLLAFLAFPDSALLVGLILTVCGLTVLLVYILIARLTSKLSSAPAPAATSPEAPPPAASRAAGVRDDDVESISSLMAEANDRLIKSPRLASSKVRPSVTGLPLYLLLGAEGSGKSSLFLASELDPELLAGEVYRDSAIVPTRILNLWFAAGCIIAEASGRFFSEEPGRLGRLVGMLLGKRGMPFLTKIFSRPQHGQRMKGVILCCPIDSFVGVPDATRQAAFLRRIQERLRAIGETLGMDFPVYVVFTKCDAIPYFGEYFSRLVEIEDQQVLGCTLPAAPAPDGRSQNYADVQTKRISDYFNRLYSSLAEHRITFLRRETERARKPPVYEFPRELKRIRGTVVPFLVDLFRPNSLQPGPLLRGFYFTGSRKVPASEAAASRTKSSPVASQKLGEATRLFRLEDLQKTSLATPAAEDSGLVTVWSFVGDLFQQIIVADRDRVSGAFIDRRLDLYRRLVFGSVVFVCLLLSFAFVRSWFGNRALLSAAQSAAAGVKTLNRPGDGPSPDNLQQIENLRSVLRTVSDNYYDGAPWKLRFGLYAGNRIYSPLYDVYFQRFREYFLGNTVRDVEAKLARLPAAQTPAFEYKAVYDDLKGYRTITTSDERSCSPDNEFTQWLMGSWRGTDLAERQFRFYVDELRAKRNPYPDLRSAPAAVKTGRSYLAAYSGIDPLYQGIVASVNEELSSTAKLSDYTQRAPDTLVLMAGSEIPGAFTRAGFNLVEKKIATAGKGTVGNPCVVGFGQSLSGLVQGSDTSKQLMNRYIRDYIDRWKRFLAATTIQNYKSPADAAHKLDFLSSNGSPLLAVLAMVAENTAFPLNSATLNPGLLTRAETQAKGNFLDKLRGRAPAVVKDAIPKADPQEVLSPQKIAQVFQPARAVFLAPNRNRLVDDVNAKYISALADLQVAMAALGEQSDPQSNVELNKTANEKAQAGLRLDRELTLKFDSGPEAVGDLVSSFLDEPFKQAGKFIVADSNKAASAKLEGGLRDLCGQLHPILRKYPFSALNEQETDLPELRSMFSPASGAFWNFHRQYTAKLLEKRGHQWFLKADAETKVTDRFLGFFNKMAAVSDALFPPDGETPLAQVTLSLPSPQGYQSVSGTVDGEDFSSAPKQYSWPGQQAGVNLRVVLTGTISTTFARYGGLWGLFRWMQSAEERPGGTATFGFINQSRASRGSQPQPILENGTPIVIQVNEFPGKMDTVFDRGFFTGIECPAHATE